LSDLTTFLIVCLATTRIVYSQYIQKYLQYIPALAFLQGQRRPMSSLARGPFEFGFGFGVGLG